MKGENYTHLDNILFKIFSLAVSLSFHQDGGTKCLTSFAFYEFCPHFSSNWTNLCTRANGAELVQLTRDETSDLTQLATRKYILPLTELLLHAFQWCSDTTGDNQSGCVFLPISTLAKNPCHIEEMAETALTSKQEK